MTGTDRSGRSRADHRRARPQVPDPDHHARRADQPGPAERGGGRARRRPRRLHDVPAWCRLKSHRHVGSYELPRGRLGDPRAAQLLTSGPYARKPAVNPSKWVRHPSRSADRYFAGRRDMTDGYQRGTARDMMQPGRGVHRGARDPRPGRADDARRSAWARCRSAARTTALTGHRHRPRHRGQVRAPRVSDPAPPTAGRAGAQGLVYVAASTPRSTRRSRAWRRNQIKRLPVIDDRRIVGMITEADLARQPARGQARRVRAPGLRDALTSGQANVRRRTAPSCGGAASRAGRRWHASRAVAADVRGDLGGGLRAVGLR